MVAVRTVSRLPWRGGGGGGGMEVGGWGGGADIWKQQAIVTLTWLTPSDTTIRLRKNQPGFSFCRCRCVTKMLAAFLTVGINGV